mmetsp:Transcript_23739/g.35987  ORF Transcript_23739/g.35987 Transcript_23739/m.35987 type:complete len:221 (-) Transcript_23739:195-857(-)|eukprot:scaffold2817_cov170-Skeletonema_dohrnii-CCMP3373.AAC.2
MNNTFHLSKHWPGGESRRNASSRAHASVKALEVEAKISMLKAIRVRMAPKYSSPSTAPSQDNAANDAEAREGSDMQILHIPTKTEDSQPGTTLNPASCASGLALLGGGGGGGEGSDWNSALSLTALVEKMRVDQGNNRRPKPDGGKAAFGRPSKRLVLKRSGRKTRRLKEKPSQDRCRFAPCLRPKFNVSPNAASSLQNEGWDDLLHLPQAQGNLFLGDR